MRRYELYRRLLIYLVFSPATSDMRNAVTIVYALVTRCVDAVQDMRNILMSSYPDAISITYPNNRVVTRFNRFCLSQLRLISLSLTS
jgi:hypothetical protein